MKIGTVEIGPGHPCAIVAELSNAHNGDRDRMGRLIDAAQAAGADIIKTQCYTPDELVALRGDGPAPEPWGSQGFTMRTLYEKARTPLDWFPHIADLCEWIGMPWFSSVFGAESLACLEAVGCPALKVSHFECANEPLLRMVGATGKPILVSSPNGLRDKAWLAGGTGGVGRIYCPGGYPTAAADMNLQELDSGDDDLGPIRFWLGLSSHCMDQLVAPAAVALGAKYIEYHMMLAEEPSELESNVSLTQYQLKHVVWSVRQTETLLG